MRRGLGPASVLLSLVLLVAIVIYAKNTNFQRQSEKFVPTAEIYDPSQTPKQTSPSSQNQSPAELAQRQDLGPLQQGLASAHPSAILEVNTEESSPGFDQRHLSVKAGEVVSLTFRNNSEPRFHYQDSWVLVKPNRAGEAGVAADRAGLQQDWIPHSSDVLAATGLLKAGESQTILFRAPSVPGDYPYISTYPGHSQVMNGVLRVQ